MNEFEDDPQMRNRVTNGMAQIAGGTFLMGSDAHYPEERPAQSVTVDGFWIDRHTGHQFRLAGLDPARATDDAGRAIEVRARRGHRRGRHDTFPTTAPRGSAPRG